MCGHSELHGGLDQKLEALRLFVSPDLPRRRSPFDLQEPPLHVELGAQLLPPLLRGAGGRRRGADGRRLSRFHLEPLRRRGAELQTSRFCCSLQFLLQNRQTKLVLQQTFMAPPTAPWTPSPAPPPPDVSPGFTFLVGYGSATLNVSAERAARDAAAPLRHRTTSQSLEVHLNV